MAGVVRIAFERTLHRVVGGDLSVMSAGVALYALLATIPALTSIVSIYSLVADASEIEAHLAGLELVFPRAVVDFLVQQLEREAERSQGEIGLALGGSLVLAMWSARAAASAVVAALHHAYRIPETRTFWQRLGFNLAVSLSAIIGLVITSGIVVALPALVPLFRLGETIGSFMDQARWPVLLVVYSGAMMALYRLAPAPRPLPVRHVWPGAVLATAVWLVSSYGLSIYVGRIADYENVYGAFGSVIVVILWFYLSALSVLLGGVLNAELERAAAPTG
jgi:membrane protein